MITNRVQSHAAVAFLVSFLALFQFSLAVDMRRAKDEQQSEVFHCGASDDGTDCSVRGNKKRRIRHRKNVERRNIPAAEPGDDVTIYFMRHAEKENVLVPTEGMGPHRFKRICGARACAEALSDFGSFRADSLLNWFDSSGITGTITHAFASHKDRARQTIEHIAAAARLENDVDMLPDGVQQLPANGTELDPESPEASIDPIVQALKSLPTKSVAVVVGHSSTLYEIFSDLGLDISNDEEYPKDSHGKVESYGDIWKVEMRERGIVLEYRVELQPGHLRVAGKKVWKSPPHRERRQGARRLSADQSSRTKSSADDVIIYFMRHAETEKKLIKVHDNSTHHHFVQECGVTSCIELLSKYGRVRSESIAKWFKLHGIIQHVTHAFSSHKACAQETLRHIAASAHLANDLDLLPDGVQQFPSNGTDLNPENTAASVAPSVQALQKLPGGSVAVVSGHSETLYEIFNRLGLDTSNDDEYPKGEDGQVVAYGNIWRVAMRERGIVLEYRVELELGRLQIVNKKVWKPSAQKPLPWLV